MFMRFLQLNLDPRLILDFRNFYDTEVTGKLRKTPGCLFAGLIKSKPEENEYISLTFWKTRQQAEDYENSEVFKKLFEKSRGYLIDTAEWKVQLSEDMELQYGQAEEEPKIKKYSVAAENGSGESFPAEASNLYIRVLSLIIREDKLDEFKKLYTDVIIPKLKSTKGCRSVFLTESVSGENEFISVTVWDGKEFADEYESSGKFEELTEQVKHTFSQLYLWKMSLDKEKRSKFATSDDFKVEGYDMVTGKSFI